MEASVIVSIAAIFVSVGLSYAAVTRKTTEFMAETRAEIRNLKHEVEKHNGIIERTYKLESDSKTAFMRIDELREADQRLEDRLEDLRRELS